MTNQEKIEAIRTYCKQVKRKHLTEWNTRYD